MRLSRQVQYRTCFSSASFLLSRHWKWAGINWYWWKEALDQASYPSPAGIYSSESHRRLLQIWSEVQGGISYSSPRIWVRVHMWWRWQRGFIRADWRKMLAPLYRRRRILYRWSSAMRTYQHLVYSGLRVPWSSGSSYRHPDHPIISASA